MVIGLMWPRFFGHAVFNSESDDASQQFLGRRLIYVYIIRINLAHARADHSNPSLYLRNNAQCHKLAIEMPEFPLIS